MKTLLLATALAAVIFTAPAQARTKEDVVEHISTALLYSAICRPFNKEEQEHYAWMAVIAGIGEHDPDMKAAYPKSIALAERVGKAKWCAAFAPIFDMGGAAR